MSDAIRLRLATLSFELAKLRSLMNADALPPERVRERLASLQLDLDAVVASLEDADTDAGER